MRLVLNFLAVGVAVALAMPASAQQPSPTLDAVKKRGQLICGVNGQAPGFSLVDQNKQWSGLDVDYCRAIAAAVLGDARKVQYVPTTAQERFDRLAKGDFDVLIRNSTVSLPRSVGVKVRYATINYVDGQAFVVPKSLRVDTALSLNGQIICVVKGTNHQSNMALWFRARSADFLVRVADTPEQMYQEFFAGKCQAVTQDASTLAGMIIESGKAQDYLMLPEFISKEPLGPYVRDGDSPWLDVVKWTHFAMVEAEEHGITSANVDAAMGTPDIRLQHFLGVLHGNGHLLGIDEKWTYNIIKQVGNYAEVFERNVGQGSPLRFPRASNALWLKGGMMFSPPFH
ncbi:MAG TPA: amino acid ABC transporter substrate-binding protein [Reyranella sp.]|nr:amino acid ABC transporter substrate-binding protein [Reyranella sp.]